MEFYRLTSPGRFDVHNVSLKSSAFESVSQESTQDASEFILHFPGSTDIALPIIKFVCLAGESQTFCGLKKHQLILRTTVLSSFIVRKDA